MLAKHKWFIASICLQLLVLSIYPATLKVKAGTGDEAGFIIEAERVVGENMRATIVAGETSRSNGKPMLKISYDSADIYGMKLTKQFKTPNGTVSITMKASGPVHISGMQIETSALAFKGACIQASKIIPNAALEDVTMVAHSMKAADSSLEQLQLQTINGDGGMQKPGTLEILQKLGSLPYEQMKKEIAAIAAGQLPLTCKETAVGAPIVDDALEEIIDPLDDLAGVAPLEDTIGEIADPLKNTIGEVTDPLKDTVGKITDPLKDTVGRVADPLKGTVGKLTNQIHEQITEKAVDPVIGEVKKAAEPVKEVVKKTVDTTLPTVEPVKEAVDQLAGNACEKFASGNGQITKELGLELIDQAIEEKRPLDELCPENKTVTVQLENWSKSLLDTLGPFPLLGSKPSEEEQLKEMREELEKEKDGAIIFK